LLGVDTSYRGKNQGEIYQPHPQKRERQTKSQRQLDLVFPISYKLITNRIILPR
jgi:hypothetical protein